MGRAAAMLKVALTGGVATGKSEVLKMFKKKGVPVLSADELVKSFQSPGNIIWQQIRKTWGKKFFLESGELDREKLSEKIFSDRKFKAQIENFTHPLVKIEIKKIFTVWEKEKHCLAAAEIPLLFQAGWESLFDLIIMTRVAKEIQIKRIVEKRKISPEKARKWQGIQTPGKEYEEKADIVLNTSLPLKQTERSIEEIIGKIKEEQR